MSSSLLSTGSSLQCPHGGQVVAVTINNRVFIDHQQALTQSDLLMVMGCPFNSNYRPNPCIGARWLVPARRVLIQGTPAILENSSGLCQGADQTPQGAVIIVTTQTRVRGI